MKHRRPIQHIRRYRTHSTVVNKGVRYRAPRRMAFLENPIERKKVVNALDKLKHAESDFETEDVYDYGTNEDNTEYITSRSQIDDAREEGYKMALNDLNLLTRKGNVKNRYRLR